MVVGWKIFVGSVTWAKVGGIMFIFIVFYNYRRKTASAVFETYEDALAFYFLHKGYRIDLFHVDDFHSFSFVRRVY